MAEPKIWGWDLEEMKGATAAADDMETGGCQATQPLASGFTPINRPQAPAAPSESIQHSLDGSLVSKVKGHENVAKEAATRERKRKVEATSKHAGSKKPRQARTVERSKDHDISKNLQRPEPAQARRKKPTDKADSLSHKVASSRDISARPGQPQDHEEISVGSEPSPQVQKETDQAIDTKAQFRGLAEGYQVAYNADTPAKDNASPSSHTFEASSNAGFERTEDSEWYDHGVNRHSINSATHEHALLNAPFKFRRKPNVQGFEPLQSAQPPNTNSFAENLEAAEPYEYLNEPGDSQTDDFDVDNSLFEDVDTSMTTVHKHGPAKELALHPAGDSDPMSEPQRPAVWESNIVDGGFANDLEGWPEDVSASDALAIYDEESTEVVDAMEEVSLDSKHSQDYCILTHVSGNVTKAPQSQPRPSHDSENEFGDFEDSDLDSGLIELTSPDSAEQQQPSTPQTSPQRPSTPKLQWLPPTNFTPAKKPPKVPASQKDVPHLVTMDAAGTYLPFARPAFPKPTLDRSPILGLTNTTVLRTCFRIGEALNAAAVASRTNVDAIIELYARVAGSSREAKGGFKQLFQFADLFTDKPPYLSGTSTVWKGVGLWDQDSRAFLGKGGRGKMCRIVGRLKSVEGAAAGSCEMVVLSIWEVGWEDVGVAKGVVFS